jgi:hypothetical protein
MASRYRAQSIYVEGKRIAFATESSVELKLGGETIITEDGIDGVTDGPISVDWSITRAIPVAGDGTSLEAYFVQGKYVKITCAPLNGKVLTFTGRIMSVSFQGSHANSTETSSLSGVGWKPEFVG